MSDRLDADTTDYTRLAADLGSVSREAAPRLKKALEVTARNVKDGWRDKLVGSSTIPAGSSAISYDIKGTAGVNTSELEAEIGPQLGRRQATIVGITETGTPKIAPRGFGLAALAENVDDFERGIDKAIDDTLRANGL